MEDAKIYFLGFDRTMKIVESKENVDKLHKLILSNKIFKRHTSYFKKIKSYQLKWLAAAVDYKKEMAKITENPNLKKISPFVFGWSSAFAGGAVSNCETEKRYLGLKESVYDGPECILVDISKNKEHLNVITSPEKIEMCKENSLMLFPDLFKMPKKYKNIRYRSYCYSDLFSLPGIADKDRTINLIIKQIKENEFLYRELEEDNLLLVQIKKEEEKKKLSKQEEEKKN